MKWYLWRRFSNIVPLWVISCPSIDPLFGEPDRMKYIRTSGTNFLSCSIKIHEAVLGKKINLWLNRVLLPFRDWKSQYNFYDFFTQLSYLALLYYYTASTNKVMYYGQLEGKEHRLLPRSGWKWPRKKEEIWLWQKGSVQMKSSMTFIRGNWCIERDKDIFKMTAKNFGSNPLLCATIFLPTKLACWHTYLQQNTHNQNDWSVKNRIEYTGFGQGFHL